MTHTNWIVMPFPTNMFSNHIGDQQTGSAKGDIVSDPPGLHAIDTAFNLGMSPTNGSIGWRVRVGRNGVSAGLNPGRMQESI